MALQTSNLTLVGHGSAKDVPPNSEQPPLVDGIHLRWAFKRELGFPWHGFYLFRRVHDPGTLSWLSQHIGKLPKGPWAGNSIDTPLGRVFSDQNLLLTEDFQPPGQVELDLANRNVLGMVFPEAEPVRRVDTSIGFRARPGDPPPVMTTVSFLERPTDSGKNPLQENGVFFETREANDRDPRPNWSIRSIQADSGPITGLGCKFRLHITLPQPATFVEVMLTGAGRRNAMDGAPTIEILDADGTRLDIVAMNDPGSRSSETFLLTGNGIKKVVVDERLSDIEVEQMDSQDRIILNKITFGNGVISEVRMTAFNGTTPVREKRVRGYAGRVADERLEFEGITSVELSSAPAALIDLGTVPLAQGTENGWTKLNGVPYPLRLPITHPDYPCTPQTPENFASARQLATNRIKYGSPEQFSGSPTPVTNAGTISITDGSPIVTGVNTNWTSDMADAVLQLNGEATVYTIVSVVSPTKLVLSRNYSGASRNGVLYAVSRDKFGQLYSYLANLVVGGKNAGAMVNRTLPSPVTTSGTVAVTNDPTKPNDSRIVVGSGTAWTAALAGLDIQIAGETVYKIARVDSSTKLTLEIPYAGATATGLSYNIRPRLQASAVDAIAPRMPAQLPLDMLLLGSLHPAVAQMSGLYWVDATADPSPSYDYLIVSDHNNVAQLNPDTMLLFIQQSGFSNLDAAIAFNLRFAPTPALARPDGLEVYALPGSSRRTEAGTAQEAVNNVGLRWNLNKTDAGVLLPGRSVMYHLWRANLGNNALPAPSGQFSLISKNWPILVVDSNGAQTSSDWPPFPLHALDNALSDGWWGYQVSGIDIFGRHTPNSANGAWRQWSPMPEPKPWYYAEPPSDAIVHQSAIQLRTKIAPPQPTAIEAYAIDPRDPMVIKDAAFADWLDRLNHQTWYQALTEDQKKNLIGLRVRWQWPQTSIDQAPHTREFRIYYQDGSLNAILGNTLAVTAASTTESIVATNIENHEDAGSYVGAALSVGDDAFVIVGSEESDPLRLRVRNVGAHNNIAPRADAPCTIAIPPAYASGVVAVTNGSQVVTGKGTNWTTKLEDQVFQIATEQRSYHVDTVISPTQLLLDEPYEGATKSDRVYGIQHPLFVDYSAAASWQKRHYVVPQDQHWTAGTDASGRFVRKYDIILPVPEEGAQPGLPLTASLTKPIVYAHASVSAADDKTYTDDDPDRTDPWSNRFGNEGRVGPPAKIFRVLRDEPATPVLPPMPERVTATRADQSGSSYYTFRWLPLAQTMTHIYRAFDEAVFKSDWSHRPGLILDPAKPDFFPSESIDPRWNFAKRKQVAIELNQLNTFAKDAAGTAQAFIHYRALSNDALRVLAGLKDNEAAFTQLTTAPLDPQDHANDNRRGPDDADNFRIGDPGNPLASPSLCAFVDTVEGLAVTRYFYRAANVDAAHNRSKDLSLATPPVYVPKVVAPQPPLPQLTLGAEGLVRLQWIASPEPDLARYLVYRTGDEGAAADVRTMSLIARVAPRPTSIPEPGDQLPIAVPGKPDWLEFRDSPAPGAFFFYRLQAEDTAANKSQGSTTLRGRALKTPPAPPVWNEPTKQGTSVLLSWTHPSDQHLSCLVERRAAGVARWFSVSGWLSRGQYSFVDTLPVSALAWEYRLRVRDELGQVSDDWPIVLVD
jgi:hypothetical protein